MKIVYYISSIFNAIVRLANSQGPIAKAIAALIFFGGIAAIYVWATGQGVPFERMFYNTIEKINFWG